jgi:hypothetical protein
MSAAHRHDVVDRCISCGTAISHAHDTLRPCRTARAAATRTSSVIRFSVPRSSSSPHRPQFDSVSKYPSTSSCVGIECVVIVGLLADRSLVVVMRTVRRGLRSVRVMVTLLLR